MLSGLIASSHVKSVDCRSEPATDESNVVDGGAAFAFVCEEYDNQNIFTIGACYVEHYETENENHRFWPDITCTFRPERPDLETCNSDTRITGWVSPYNCSISIKNST